MANLALCIISMFFLFFRNESVCVFAWCMNFKCEPALIWYIFMVMTLSWGMRIRKKCKASSHSVECHLWRDMYNAVKWFLNELPPKALSKQERSNTFVEMHRFLNPFFKIQTAACCKKRIQKTFDPFYFVRALGVFVRMYLGSTLGFWALF